MLFLVICLPKGDQSPKAWSEKRGYNECKFEVTCSTFDAELKACMFFDGTTQWLSKVDYVSWAGGVCHLPIFLCESVLLLLLLVSLTKYLFSLSLFSRRSLQFIVVLLDTTKESSLDWTRYPYGPQSRTPGVSIMRKKVERMREEEIVFCLPPCLVPISFSFLSTSANLSSFASFHAWSSERFSLLFLPDSLPPLLTSTLSPCFIDLYVMTTFKPHFTWFTASDQMVYESYLCFPWEKSPSQQSSSFSCLLFLLLSLSFFADLQWVEESFTNFEQNINWRSYVVCDVAYNNVNNWLWTPFIERKDANRIYIEIKFSMRDCNLFPGKKNEATHLNSLMHSLLLVKSLSDYNFFTRGIWYQMWPLISPLLSPMSLEIPAGMALSCKETFSLLYYEFDSAHKEPPPWEPESYKLIDRIAADEGRFTSNTEVSIIWFYKLTASQLTLLLPSYLSSAH